MNRPRAKGTMAESAVVAYLRDNGFPYAERRSLKGSLDQGDVTGTPGLCWEVKYGDSGLRLGPWIAQTEVERVNSGSDYGILVIKPMGLGARSTRLWYAAMSVPGHDTLIRQADELLDGSLAYLNVEPVRFTAGILKTSLTKLDADPLVTRHGTIPAVTVVPPGAVGAPQAQYRVMRLWAAVQLVRAAGYGNKLGVEES